MVMLNFISVTLRILHKTTKYKTKNKIHEVFKLKYTIKKETPPNRQLDESK